MSIVFILLPLALFLSLTFLAGFLTQVARGQYDDLETPAHRMLLDDEVTTQITPPSTEVIR
jgi:cbb3-type cytochrome oxidase maturation protein